MTCSLLASLELHEHLGGLDEGAGGVEDRRGLVLKGALSRGEGSAADSGPLLPRT